MGNRERLLYLVLTMAGVSLVVGLVTIYLLYHAALEQQRTRLADTAGIQARLMESAARLHNGDPNATLEQMLKVHRTLSGFGESGEYTIGYQEGDTLFFLLEGGGYDLDEPRLVPADSARGEPMRQALLGRSGTTVGRDHRGVMVLAAHQPLKELGWGLVAKIDLAEIRGPFVRAGVLAGCAGLVAMVVGSALFLRLTNPLIRRMEESESRTRAIVDTAVDPIITINDDGLVQSFNSASETVFGYSADEVIGRNVNLLMPPPYREEHDDYIRNYLRSGERKIIGIGREVTGLRKDGTRFPMELAVSEVRFGKRAVFAGIVRDITDRKRAEQQLAQLNRELAEKNKELERVVYVTSHDLRSPLVNIQGFSKELNLACQAVHSALERGETVETIRNELRSVLEEDVPEALHYIMSGASKMEALLAGLLRLSRLGRMALTIEQLDMNALLASIEAAMEFQVKELEADLEAEDLPPCSGDEVQINQVFSNLLENALKYRSPSRKPRIHVSGRREAKHAVYCVRDNGVGIPPGQQEKVFEIFHRLDNSVGDGEGLGLTIARLIVSRHNGEMWFESEQGKGSAFYVSLPAGKST